MTTSTHPLLLGIVVVGAILIDFALLVIGAVTVIGWAT